jgi:hypothetical protein
MAVHGILCKVLKGEAKLLLQTECLSSMPAIGPDLQLVLVLAQCCTQPAVRVAGVRCWVCCYAGVLPLSVLVWAKQLPPAAAPAPAKVTCALLQLHLCDISGSWSCPMRQPNT